MKLSPSEGIEIAGKFLSNPVSIAQISVGMLALDNAFSQRLEYQRRTELEIPVDSLFPSGAHRL